MLTLLLAATAIAAPLRDTIDAHVAAGQKRAKVAAVATVGDAGFLRRVTLDLVGTVPSYAEVSAFLADTSADKRAKAIDRLLADPRFAANQATVWDLVFFGRNPAAQEVTRDRTEFRAWLTERFAKNAPWDATVRELLLARESGSEIFLSQFRNAPENAAEGVSRLFLGKQLQCARCHDHPYEAWTQKDFFGMAGFFVRNVVQEVPGGGNKRKVVLGEKSTGDVLFSGSAKDAVPGKKGEPIKPKFLGGEQLAEPETPKGAKEPDAKGKLLPKPAFSRREKLAEWLPTAKNPWFATAVVNRVWGQFMGRGLVHPVDDLGGRNPALYPELLQELAKAFVADKFDVKNLIREIVSSKTYQAGTGGDSTDASPVHYERARVRPLSAEEMLQALMDATGHLAAGGKPGGVGREYMVRYFGSPTNGLGDFQAGLGEHFFFNNSGDVRNIIARKKGSLADVVLLSKDAWPDRVDRLFLSVLSRKPTDAERARFAEYLSAKTTRPDALVEEAIWVLVNTAEFRFNR